VAATKDPRKPRDFPPGIDAACNAGEPGPDRRLSFCCEREGCRKRHTPASVRFLGRRVYVGVIVVLIMAIGLCLPGDRGHPPAPELGVSRRTLGRWRRWWREDFPTSVVWRAAQGRLMPPVDASALPASLLPRFGEPLQEQVLGGATAALAAVGDGPAGHVMSGHDDGPGLPAEHAHGGDGPDRRRERLRS
jgi:hypothetical protein